MNYALTIRHLQYSLVERPQKVLKVGGSKSDPDLGAVPKFHISFTTVLVKRLMSPALPLHILF